MRKELDNLWYSYLIESILKKSDKEKDLIKQFSTDNDALRDALNNQQKELLEKYDQSLSTLNGLTEKWLLLKVLSLRFAFCLNRFVKIKAKNFQSIGHSERSEGSVNCYVEILRCKLLRMTYNFYFHIDLVFGGGKPSALP